MNKTFVMLSIAWRIARGLRHSDTFTFILQQLHNKSGNSVIAAIPQKPLSYPKATVHFTAAQKFYEACATPALSQSLSLTNQLLPEITSYSN